MKLKISVISLISIFLIPASECIINGVPAKLGEFPYMVGLVIKDYHLLNCGGAIISSRLVLTTAHCVCDLWSYKYYYALVGTVHINESGYQYDLEASICYEDFNPKALSDDIGMVKTVKPFQFGPNVQLISLQLDDIPEGDKLTATGWGCLSKNRTFFPNDLRYSYLEVLAPETCKRLFWASRNFKFICTRTTTTRGMCAGDSGGPVMYEKKLAGISYGGSRQAPDLFVKISDYVPWIQRKIFELSKNQEGKHYDDGKDYINFSFNHYNSFKKLFYDKLNMTRRYLDKERGRNML